jgi:hypothetical protein
LAAELSRVNSTIHGLIVVAVLNLNGALCKVYLIGPDRVLRFPEIFVTVREVASVAEQAVTMLLEVTAFFRLILNVDLFLLEQVVLEILKVRHLRPVLRNHLRRHLISVARHEDLVLELHRLLVSLEVVLQLHHVWNLRLRHLAELHLRHHPRKLVSHNLVRDVCILVHRHLLLFRHNLRFIGGWRLLLLLRM